MDTLAVATQKASKKHVSAARMLTNELLTLNDSGLETKCSPMTVAEGRDVLTTLVNRGKALLGAGDLPAQDRGGIAHDLRVSACYGLSALER